MPLLDASASLGPVLERNGLLAALLAEDASADCRIGHDGPTDCRRLAIPDQQDALEVDLLAGLDIKQLDRELGAELDSVLLAAGLDDCVHGSSGG